jgi:hypothetical protein
MVTTIPAAGVLAECSASAPADITNLSRLLDPRSLTHKTMSRNPSCPSRRQGTQSTTCWGLSYQITLLDTQAFNFDNTPRQSHGRSRLLDLPLELRERIYENVLTTPNEIYLGIVGLEQHRPHHWHMAVSLHKCFSRSSCGMRNRHGLGRTPICAHKRASPPYHFCLDLLLVCKQLHAECAHILYNRNKFSIDLDVPETRESAKLYDISLLRLADILPLNQAYHTSLRNVSFRLLNEDMTAYPVQFFNSIMMYLLQDTPGVYVAFRRRYDHYDLGIDFEVFAGWSPTAAPTWLADASASLMLGPSWMPLELSNSNMSASEAHWNMSMLWERAPSSDFGVTQEHAKKSRLDLCVWSDPCVYAGPWRSDDPKSREAARIFLLRPSKGNKLQASVSGWTGQRTRVLSPRALRWQTYIIGTSRNLRKYSYCQRKPEARIRWQEGGHWIKRLLFTQRTSFLTRPICRLVRNVQVWLDEKRLRDELAGLDGPTITRR